MRKSEFKRAFLVEWNRDRPAEAAVIAAEAAGVVWDPEEEPLPEEIFISEGECTALAVGYKPFEEDSGNFWALVEGPIPSGGLGVPLARRAVIAREAVRRWNAWKEIRRLVECAAWPPSAIKSAVLAILDGKEGE